MRVECITFKRCCFCIPLRYGLLATGYIKLIWTLFMLSGVITQLVRFMFDVRVREHLTNVMWSLIIVFAVVLVLLCDVALSIVFIVGGHKKDPKLMKIYYYYAIVICTLFLISFILLEGFDIYGMGIRYGIMDTIFILRASIILGLTYFGFEIYTILLIRSEIAKLESNCTFRFVNNATEGECTMVKDICEDGITKNEIINKVIEDSEKSETEDAIITVNENEADKANNKRIYTRLA